MDFSLWTSKNTLAYCYKIFIEVKGLLVQLINWTVGYKKFPLVTEGATEEELQLYKQLMSNYNCNSCSEKNVTFKKLQNIRQYYKLDN